VPLQALFAACMCKTAASKTGKSSARQYFSGQEADFISRGSAFFVVYAAARIAQPVLVGNN
jgi:hypothetical protein